MNKSQLLRCPNTYEDMKHSISLTGITTIKEKAYKSRISGSKEFIHSPVDTIVRKKIYDLDFTIEKKRKKRKVLPNPGEPIQPKAKRQNKSYTINKKEVSHRIRNYINQQKGIKKLYFWTVTFPLNTTDDTAFILLNKWLTRLRKEQLLKSYLWVSERQENGTIHFHIAIPHYMNVQKANKYMRASIMWCIKDGSIEKFAIPPKNYNGVDIAKNRKTKRITNFAANKKDKALTSYLTKYVTKNNTSFQHLAWHCSRDFSNIIIAFRLLESELITSQINLLTNPEKTFENDWIIFVPWRTSPPDIVRQYLARVNHILQSQLN